MTVHRPTIDRPSSPQEKPMFNLTLSGWFGSLQPAHPCFDQFSTVKTGYPPTSITWPCRGFRYRPIEVVCCLQLSANKLVFKWSHAHVEFFFKYIGNKLCSWAAPLESLFQTELGRQNWASCYRQGRQLLWNFSPWSRVDHALHPIFMLWLVKCDRRVSAENLCSTWKLVYW